MFKRILSAVSVGLVTLAVGSASASTIAPGGSQSASVLDFGGTQVWFTGGALSTSAFSANYSASVYVDPSNVFCANCLDFVYLINETGAGSVTSLSAGAFGGYETSVGYDLFGGGNVAPTTITRSADGSTIDFLFANGVPVNLYSDYLVVETNATSFNTLGTTTLANGDNSSTGIGEEPVPEPSSFFLLGTGLIGLAGAAKRKLSV